MAWTLLRSGWPVAVLLLAVIGLQHGQITGARTQRNEALQDAAYIRQQLTVQNAAVAQWRQAAIAQAQQYEQAVIEADRLRKQGRAKATQVMQAAVPAQCEQAMTWLVQTGRQMAEDWHGR